MIGFTNYLHDWTLLGNERGESICLAYTGLQLSLRPWFGDGFNYNNKLGPETQVDSHSTLSRLY